MEPEILQETFNPLLPIAGDKCKDILRKIDPEYKEINKETIDKVRHSIQTFIDKMIL